VHQIESMIGLTLARTSHCHRLRAAEALAAYDLHPGQELLLLQLFEAEGLMQSQFSARLGIEPPTISKSLHKLESAGLITRRVDAEDGRIVRIYLTDRGRALEADILDVWHTLEAQTLQGLTDVEQIVLRRLLLQIQHNLRAY